jgi:predicted  nucleic acid-binding Zn-ribbon protein
MNDKEVSTLGSLKSSDRGESNTPRTAIEKDSMEQLSSTAKYNKSLETVIFLKKSLEEVKRKKERLEKQFADDLSTFQHLKRQGLKHDKEQAKLIGLGKHLSSTKQEMDRIKKELESANQQIAQTRQLTGEMARFITNSSPTPNRATPQASLSPKAVGTSV